MKAKALHGAVIINGWSFTREEAIKVLLEIAQAVHSAGDISDPFAVELLELLQNEVKTH